jgi:hypothetical protein
VKNENGGAIAGAEAAQKSTGHATSQVILLRIGELRIIAALSCLIRFLLSTAQ